MEILPCGLTDNGSVTLVDNALEASLVDFGPKTEMMLLPGDGTVGGEDGDVKNPTVPRSGTKWERSLVTLLLLEGSLGAHKGNTWPQQGDIHFFEVGCKYLKN